MEARIEKKVCIVGSGFTGYTIYKKLLKENIDLILVEGGKKSNPKSKFDQPYYKTINNKHSSKISRSSNEYRISNKIDLSFRDRRFTLGGSSEGWTGMIKPFEETTYKNSFNNLGTQQWGDLNFKKYYKEALEILRSPIDNFNPYHLAKSLDINLLALPKGLFYSVYAWAESNVRLKEYWLDKSTADYKNLSNSKNVLYGFKLIDANLKKGKIESLVFKSQENKKFLVSADIFVICMGGVENAKFAKLLKIKNNDLNDLNIIGNFQEHPHFYWTGQFKFRENSLPLVFKERIPYCESNKSNKGFIKFSIGAWDGYGSPKVTFDFVQYKPKIKGLIKYSSRFLKFYDWHIHMRCEQTPNNKSFLNFTNDKNYLNWNIIDSDLEFYIKYLKRLIDFLEDNNLIEKFNFDYKNFRNQLIPIEAFGAGHHMGTVPYTLDELVINRKLQHKNFKNSYFIGSCIFPTSGYENPTHTIVSTALATADHIKNII